eukprot:CAMPEP_0172582068 /NCGR_PEP_ID=MMETSP1068-20121228/1483_1 /TAXON_ID=35684 /ORGANISM="Pseudopedinella elastica, Strain CCMP716" /LENGTH=230 /DNA_ID=CAMNT_0013375279 /DNA_START=59 /DNA_END=751 /DNA_ORIENTATION=+
MQTIVLFALLAPVTSFAPVVRESVWTRSVARGVTAKEAYAAAEEATKKFGVTSKEARLAWEELEDIENKGGALHIEAMKEAFSADPTASTATKVKAFEENMRSLDDLSNAAKTINMQIKSEILKLQSLKLGTDTLSAAAAVSSEAYQTAKAEAEAATAKHGADSSESKVAWEAVFEIVSAADDDNVKMSSLEDECLTSSSAKCLEYNMAMDQLRSAIVNAEGSDFNKARD